MLGFLAPAEGVGFAVETQYWVIHNERVRVGGSLRKLWFIILGFIVALVPTRVSASELNLLGMGASSIVTLDGNVSGSFYAGEIDWMWTAPTPDGFDTYIYTYCVDIANEVENPQQVRISDTTDPEMTAQNPAMATDGGAKAAWLLNSYAAGIHASGDGTAAAALQVAIWEAITDDVLDLTAGGFILKTTGEYTGVDVALDIFDTASGYLADLSTADYHNSVATWLDAEYGQDQIATPEPSSLMLLSVAGLFMRRRRTNFRA